MVKYVLPLLMLILAAGCPPPVKEPVFNERYVKNATKEEVFNQSLIGVTMIAGAVDRSSSLEKGIINSVMYKPRIKVDRPTLHYITVRIKEEKHKASGLTYYVPYFTLYAKEAINLQAHKWREADPPRKYKSFMETSMRDRVIHLISGTLHEIVPKDHYLGCIIVKDKVPLYTSPAKKQLVQVSGMYQFGELQFAGFKPYTAYRNNLLQIKYWAHGGEKHICWIDDNSVRLFMFTFPHVAATAELWKEDYRRAFLKAVTREIGLHKGVLKKWDHAVMQGIAHSNVIIGMTEEQAVAAAGYPDNTEIKSDPQGKDLKVFSYDEGDIRNVTFFSGRVIKVVKQ
jgi:hypothetical protein